MKKIFLDFLERYASLCLFILNIAGVILIITFLAPHSELENQFLFGLSPRRFVLGSIFIFFWIVNSFGLFWNRLRLTYWGIKIENKADSWIPVLLVLLYLTAFTAATIWFAMLAPIIRIFKFLLPFRDQLGDLLLWLFRSEEHTSEL